MRSNDKTECEIEPKLLRCKTSADTIPFPPKVTPPLKPLTRLRARQSLAGGLLCGLCRRLGLDTRLQHLVAYVYALLDDEGQQALPISRLMLEKPQPRLQRDAFERGESEAESIAEMLAYYRHTM